MHRSLAVLVLALLLVGGALTVPSARGASSGVVVSQVFAGGGNSGAPYLNDFVELFNRGSTAIDVTGWTVQYAGASGTSWQATALAGSIAPGGHYLVALSSGGSDGAALPAADATGSSNLAVSGGKVAVVSDATELTCGAAAGSCSAVPAVVDLVGYGGASDYEGSGPAAALANDTAAVRAGDGCVDTDDNAADVPIASPSPRNTSSAASVCASEPPAGGLTQDATVDIDIESALSLALERPSVSFGAAATGTTPTPVSEQVTVVSNIATGYALTVHRAAFAPVDLPLGIAGAAPGGGQVGAALAGGATAAIPIAPAADLLVGTTAAPSAGGGDVWGTSLGFAAPLPDVPAGRYTTTVTFTVIGR